MAPQVSKIGSRSSAAPRMEPPLIARRWLLSAQRSAASRKWSMASAASAGACCQACQPRNRLLRLRANSIEGFDPMPQCIQTQFSTGPLARSTADVKVGMIS